MKKGRRGQLTWELKRKLMTECMYRYRYTDGEKLSKKNEGSTERDRKRERGWGLRSKALTVKPLIKHVLPSQPANERKEILHFFILYNHLCVNIRCLNSLLSFQSSTFMLSKIFTHKLSDRHIRAETPPKGFHLKCFCTSKSSVFVSGERQISCGIDKRQWFPNATLHDAVRCNTELCWDCLYLGASSSPPWPVNHNTACGCITVRTGGADEVAAHCLSALALSFCSFVFFTCLFVLTKHILSFNMLSLTSLLYSVIYWANGHLQSKGLAHRGSANALNCLF